MPAVWIKVRSAPKEAFFGVCPVPGHPRNRPGHFGRAEFPEDTAPHLTARGVLWRTPMKVSPCGRFTVLDALYLDREVLLELSSWAAARGLGLQDAVQLAVLSFVEQLSAADSASPVVEEVRPMRRGNARAPGGH